MGRSRGFLNGVFSSLDKRIDALNDTFKSVYAVTCSDAFTRPSGCSELAQSISNLIQANNNHSQYMCVFNLADLYLKLGHDHTVVTGKQAVEFSSYLCQLSRGQPDVYYDQLKVDLGYYFSSGEKDRYLTENRGQVNHGKAVPHFLTWRTTFNPASTPTSTVPSF